MKIQSNKYHLFIPKIKILPLIILGIVLYGCLISVNSTTRLLGFSNDSMNYVDVARNISSGKGIVQSTLGFNQPYLFQKDSLIPSPFTSQPPLYPILISMFALPGFPHASVALVIPVMAYGFILVFAYFLSRDLYNHPTGIITVDFLLLYAPLMLIIRMAWSESLSIMLFLISLWLLVRRKKNPNNHIRIVVSFGSGIAAGLAFSTRYSMIPILVVGIIYFTIELFRDPNNFFTLGVDFISYIIGFSIPAGLVLGHNLLVSNQLLPDALPSDLDFWTNLLFTTKAVFGNYYSNRGGLSSH